MICARGRINKSNLVSAKRYEFWREIAVTRYHVNIINIIIVLLIELKGNNNYNNNKKHFSRDFKTRSSVDWEKNYFASHEKERKEKETHSRYTIQPLRNLVETFQLCCSFFSLRCKKKKKKKGSFEAEYKMKTTCLDCGCLELQQQPLRHKQT